MDVTSRIHNRAHKRGVYKSTEVCLHNKHILFTPQEFATWTKQILEGERLESRVLDMPMDFVQIEAKRDYLRYVDDALREHSPDLSAHGF